MVNPHYSHFWIITAIFWVDEFWIFFTVFFLKSTRFDVLMLVKNDFLSGFFFYLTTCSSGLVKSV